MSAEKDLSTRIKDHFAAHTCNYHLKLYASSGNGAHAWRAYTAFRRMSGDQSLPPMIARYFDHCAAQLESAESPAAIKTALALAKYDELLEQHISGRGYGFNYADNYARQSDVVRSVITRFRLFHERGEKPLMKDLIDQAAKDSGRTPGSVKQLLRDWGVDRNKLVELAEHR